jgi:hypothetical protein
MASEGQPMNVLTSGGTHRRASVVRRAILAVALVGAARPANADPQAGRAAANPRPNQPIGSADSYSAAMGRGRSTPLLVKDPTAAERARSAERAYQAALEGWARSVQLPPRPGAGPPVEAGLFDTELAERLGRWSRRWQEAQDNAAKSLAARYQAVSDHLARMSALEDGRSAYEAVGRAAGRKPPTLFADIAQFFRPVDDWDTDRVVPGLVEVERPLNPRGIAVTPGDRVEIAARVYRGILDEAVARSLASRDANAIFDAALAERLGSWSDLWRQAGDAAVADPALRSATVRDRSARPARAGARFVGPDSRPITTRAHLERMAALEDGRSLHDAFTRAGRPADEPVDMTRLREFVAVARFFRIAAESWLPEAPRVFGPDATASGQAAAAGRIYRAILDEAAGRYREAPRAGGATPDARLVFDGRLAERLGCWSVRWARAQAGPGADFGARFAAVRAHLERMAAIEDGRALNESLARDGRGMRGVAAPAPPREFAEVARFFRLQALWELEQVRSR